MVSAAAVVAAAALLVRPGFGAAQSGPSWPTFQASAQHNGILNVTGPVNGTVANEWTLPGPVYGSTALDSAGNGYVGDDDGNVYELSPTNANAPVRTFKAGGPVHVGPTLSPDGSTLVVGTTNGIVTEFKTSDGSTIWTQTVGGSITGSPVLGPDGTVYVANSGNVYALSGKDGSVVWKTSTPSGSVTGGLTLSADNNTVYVPTSSNQIVGLVASTGKTSGGGYYTAGTPESAPAIDNTGTIYETTGIGGGDLEAFSPSGTSSSAEWTFTTNANLPARSTPTIYNGQAIFGDDDGGLYAVSTTGHSATWVFRTGAAIDDSPAIATGNNMIYFGSTDGHIYALDTNGNQKWAFNAGVPIYASPSLASDHSMWIGAPSDIVYRFADLSVPPPPSQQATATPTSSATATATPTSTGTTGGLSLKVHVSGKVTPGKKETLTFTTAANTRVNFHITYPDGKQTFRHVITNASGTATYSFKVPASRITRTKHYAAIVATVGSGATAKTVNAKFGIKYAHIDVWASKTSVKVGQTVTIYVHAGKNVKVQAKLTSSNHHTVTLYGKAGPKGWATLGWKVQSKLKGSGTTTITVVARINSKSPHYTTKTTFTIK